MYVYGHGIRFALNEHERWSVEDDIKTLQSLRDEKGDDEDEEVYALCIQGLECVAYTDEGQQIVETRFSPLVMPAEEAKQQGFKILDVSDELEYFLYTYCADIENEEYYPV